MKKKRSRAKVSPPFVDEWEEWRNLTPSQRLAETTKLWQIYLALGGSLDPEPDPQSPFYVQET